jgi:hypothetical protein
MTGYYSADFLTEILERALTAIVEQRREHVCRWDYLSHRNVTWHYDHNLDRLNACCPGFTITTEDGYWGVVQDCLELALENPVETYKRPENPICSHREADGHEMYAFVVKLEDFTRPIYTKFCLKELADGTYYVSISCHT